ncbi:hypothetical protein L6452_22399 [Arctium lappa]|uniref:Uncharacterized protein n=1 Tax=Arctium lappa TaxID=4217 RepID=A0ACB9AYV2_ARCLA|nr:hypothetical protein L6452_22399 [Arctium lappa]
MLGVSNSSIVSPLEELVVAKNRTPSSKITTKAFVNQFVRNNTSTVPMETGDNVQLVYTHHNESITNPRLRWEH